LRATLPCRFADCCASPVMAGSPYKPPVFFCLLKTPCLCRVARAFRKKNVVPMWRSLGGKKQEEDDAAWCSRILLPHQARLTSCAAGRVGSSWASVRWGSWRRVQSLAGRGGARSGRRVWVRDRSLAICASIVVGSTSLSRRSPSSGMVSLYFQ
jgi:hypothetical protein